MRRARRIALDSERAGRRRRRRVRGRDARRDVAVRLGAEEQVEVVVDRGRERLDGGEDRARVRVPRKGGERRVPSGEGGRARLVERRVGVDELRGCEAMIGPVKELKVSEQNLGTRGSRIGEEGTHRTCEMTGEPSKSKSSGTTRRPLVRRGLAGSRKRCSSLICRHSDMGGYGHCARTCGKRRHPSEKKCCSERESARTRNAKSAWSTFEGTLEMRNERKEDAPPTMSHAPRSTRSCRSLTTSTPCTCSPSAPSSAASSSSAAHTSCSDCHSHAPARRRYGLMGHTPPSPAGESPLGGKRPRCQSFLNQFCAQPVKPVDAHTLALGEGAGSRSTQRPEAKARAGQGGDHDESRALVVAGRK